MMHGHTYIKYTLPFFVDKEFVVPVHTRIYDHVTNSWDNLWYLYYPIKY